MSENESNLETEMNVPRVLTPQPPECRHDDRHDLRAERNDLEIDNEPVTMREVLRRMEEQNIQQGAHIDVLLAVLTHQAQPRSTRDFKLTSFDADDSPYCMREWLNIADQSRQQHHVSDSDMILKVGDALRKRAAKFFRYWKPLERTWTNLVTDLVSAFPVSTTPYLTIVALANERSKDAETLSTYCHRKLRLIHSIEGLSFNWDATLSIIEGCLDNTDARTRIKQTRPTNETELIVIMGLIDNEIRLKRQEKSTEHRSSRFEPYNRERTGTRTSIKFLGKCNLCNRTGHRAIDCRTNMQRSNTYKHRNQRWVSDDRNPARLVKPQNTADNDKTQASTSRAADKKCENCKRYGHVKADCFFINGFPKRETAITKALFVKTSRERNTAPIAVANKATQKEFQCIIDTGAETSLIHENTCLQLGAKLWPTTGIIRGVGLNFTKALGSCRITTQLPQATLEIDFLIVPNGTIPNVDALIGWDVISQPGLQLIKTSEGLDLCHELNALPAQIIETNKDWSGVDEQIQQEIEAVINQSKNETPNHVTTGELTIQIKDTTPVAYRPRPLAYSERQKLKEIIKQQLQDGVIQNSQSEYASPIVLVKKRNGELRLCVDYRDLNRRVIKDRYPLPRIQDQLDALSKAKYYTTLDMEAGFHQLMVTPESRHVLAFITPDGHYEYLRMPFGFVNSPSCYQRAIDKALGDLKDHIAFVYLDDVLIPSTTKKEGMERLKIVMKALSTSGFKLNLKKCKFFATRTEYLGVILENGTQQPSPRKVEALKNTSPPKDIKGVRQLMGLAGYFRKFIQGFSTKTAPITKLLKKDVPFKWTNEQEQIRQDLIKTLIAAPVLILFSDEAETQLHTDASALGVGAVLMQKEAETSQFKPVAYYSRRTTTSEEKYHSYDLETLAIVEATQHFRVYLYGRQFTIYTDCNSVRATALKKELHPRVARWWIKLQDFTFDIEYRPGEKMAHVDYLSRNPIINLVQTADLTKERKQEMTIKEWQEIDPVCQDMRQTGVYPTNFKETNDLITFEGKAYVPLAARLTVLQKYHDEASHPGADRMTEAMRKDLHWKGMHASARKYTANCRACTMGKNHTGKKVGSCQQKEKPKNKLEVWHIDHAGPLIKAGGNTQILVIIDAYTKYVKLCPIKRRTTDYTIKALQKVFDTLGKPRQIIADRALAFTAVKFKNYMKDNEIKLHHIATGMPRGNGQVERVMRTLFDMLRATLIQKGEQNWSKELPILEDNLNHLKNETTGETPALLMFGKDERLQAVKNLVPEAEIKELTEKDKQKVAERIDKKTAEMRKRFNEKRAKIQTEYKAKDLVVIQKTQIAGGKLAPRFTGPFEIVKLLENDRYVLKRVNGQKREAVAGYEQLRRWPENKEK